VTSTFEDVADIKTPAAPLAFMPLLFEENLWKL
jgi:hypothetical protein